MSIPVLRAVARTLVAVACLAGIVTQLVIAVRTGSSLVDPGATSPTSATPLIRAVGARGADADDTEVREGAAPVRG
ncbi:hypothetical protein [Oryzobacter telluris]|uniref:hypothetical protein n=1 Tax=Oryzobacter telluris TaxID=3149179 RepID=UPI00370DB90C